jgi:hypothetical protein
MAEFDLITIIAMIILIPSVIGVFIYVIYHLIKNPDQLRPQRVRYKGINRKRVKPLPDQNSEFKEIYRDLSDPRKKNFFKIYADEKKLFLVNYHVKTISANPLVGIFFDILLYVFNEPIRKLDRRSYEKMKDINKILNKCYYYYEFKNDNIEIKENGGHIKIHIQNKNSFYYGGYETIHLDFFIPQIDRGSIDLKRIW